MAARGCTAGCLAVIGVFLLAAGFSATFEGFLVLLVMALVPFAGAWLLVRGGVTERRAAAEGVREVRERAVLALAAQNDGVVTPGMVAMHVRGLTVKSADALLQELARGGFCILDSDDEGRPFYQFAMGRQTEPATEISPDAWVDQMSGRPRMASSEDQDVGIDL